MSQWIALQPVVRSGPLADRPDPADWNRALIWVPWVDDAPEDGETVAVSDGVQWLPISGVGGGSGTPGADGSVWRTGSGAPSDAVGVDGDLYLDTDTGDVYQRAAGVYDLVANVKGVAGADGADSIVPGPPGADGADGADSTVPGPPGDDGLDGSTWRSGTGPPDDGDGSVDGDFYFDDADSVPGGSGFAPLAGGVLHISLNITGGAVKLDTPTQVVLDGDGVVVGGHCEATLSGISVTGASTIVAQGNASASGMPPCEFGYQLTSKLRATNLDGTEVIVVVRIYESDPDATDVSIQVGATAVTAVAGTDLSWDDTAHVIQTANGGAFFLYHYVHGSVLD